MKRSDLPTSVVLRVVGTYGPHAWDILCEAFPPKVVRAAFQREVDANRLDYGVCIEKPFLTEDTK